MTPPSRPLLQALYAACNVAAGFAQHRDALMATRVPEFLPRYLRDEDPLIRVAAAWVVVNLAHPGPPAEAQPGGGAGAAAAPCGPAGAAGGRGGGAVRSPEAQAAAQAAAAAALTAALAAAASAAERRVARLRGLGVEAALGENLDHPSTDLKDRVRTALDQFAKYPSVCKGVAPPLVSLCGRRGGGFH